MTVFDTFNARAEYLNCLKVPVTSQAAAGANQGGGGGNPGPVSHMIILIEPIIYLNGTDW